MTLNVYPKSYRLCHTLDITRVFQEGQGLSLGPMRAKFLSNAFTHSRFLISISRKVGSAPTRNHYKRLIKEALRLQLPKHQLHYDVCIILTVKPQAPMNYDYVGAKMATLFARLNAQTANSTL